MCFTALINVLFVGHRDGFYLFIISATVQKFYGIRKACNTHTGLTYEYMENFIKGISFLV